MFDVYLKYFGRLLALTMASSSIIVKCKMGLSMLDAHLPA